MPPITISIRKGIKRDYLVAVEGDPLADVNVAIAKVKWVMKAGTVAADKTRIPPQ